MHDILEGLEVPYFSATKMLRFWKRSNAAFSAPQKRSVRKLNVLLTCWLSFLELFLLVWWQASGGASVGQIVKFFPTSTYPIPTCVTSAPKNSSAGTGTCKVPCLVDEVLDKEVVTHLV